MVGDETDSDGSGGFLSPLYLENGSKHQDSALA
jgi:hypothetical protein